MRSSTPRGLTGARTAWVWTVLAAAAISACGGALANPATPSAVAAAAPAAPDASAPGGPLFADGAPEPTPADPGEPADPAAPTSPGLYARFEGVQIAIEGSTVVLRATSVPNHPSPYFGPGHALYEAPHAGMVVNPNRIREQSLVLRVPASPALAGMSDTPMGPIGLSVNGVALFNQYAAFRQPLTFELATFDRLNGHPQQSGLYHYHMEPLAVTAARGPASLIGVLLDGFPVYGPQDAGGVPGDLDVCNGHAHATPEFPGGVYHYHATSAAPYLSGCFRGTPGRVG